MSLRTAAYLCLLAFVITLAVLIGWRLSDQAAAVIIGVVAGVSASIPTSLIVVWATLRGRGDQPPAAAPPEPRVIIIQPARASAAPDASERSQTALPVYDTPQATGYSRQPGPRQFTIIGGED